MATASPATLDPVVRCIMLGHLTPCILTSGYTCIPDYDPDVKTGFCTLTGESNFGI